MWLAGLEEVPDWVVVPDPLDDGVSLGVTVGLTDELPDATGVLDEIPWLEAELVDETDEEAIGVVDDPVTELEDTTGVLE